MLNPKNGILVSGTSNVKVNLSPCCSPLPGDKIIGYVSRGQGIKVHRIDCPNIKDETRLIQVMWNPNMDESKFPVNILISANDRFNLLIDIMNLFSQLSVPCQKISAKTHKENSTASINATVLIPSLSKMQDLFNNIVNVEGVYEVKRVTK